MYRPKTNYFHRKPKVAIPRTNHRIRSLDVQVISSGGENLGVLPINKAIQIAKETLPQIEKRKIPTSYFLETLIEDRHHAFVEFDTDLIAELTKKIKTLRREEKREYIYDTIIHI